MSTRGRIGVLRPDGRVESIYNHYDSYLEGAGEALKNIRDPKLVDELIALGGRKGIYADDDAAGNTTNMLDFMRGGNIRLVPETNAIDIMKAPTPQQLRAIYNMYRQGALEGIQISNPSDKYGQQLDYLEGIQNEQQIRNLFKKHYDYL